MLYYVTLYKILCYVSSCNVISCNSVSCCVMLCRSMLYYSVGMALNYLIPSTEIIITIIATFAISVIVMIFTLVIIIAIIIFIIFIIVAIQFLLLLSLSMSFFNVTQKETVKEEQRKEERKKKLTSTGEPGWQTWKGTNVHLFSRCILCNMNYFWFEPWYHSYVLSKSQLDKNMVFMYSKMTAENSI